MPLFKRKKQEKNNYIKNISLQTRPKKQFKNESFFGLTFNNSNKYLIYKKIRNYIPLIDAALDKIKKLTLSFNFSCEDKKAENFLNKFLNNIKVGYSGMGILSFMQSYLDSLLTYGTAVGEIVVKKDPYNENCEIKALYNANMEDIILKTGKKNPLDVDIYIKGENGLPVVAKNKKLILFSSLNPEAGEITGKSILEGLYYVSDILLKIYNAIGNNFDRVGNIRFLINYNPGNSEVDKNLAKERIQAIAEEWSKIISASKYGEIRDFISFGDVKIKPIGAENQLIECKENARLMVEQIVAKLGVPPFILGLNWNSTERMSDQQAKFFIKDINYYRGILEPILIKIAKYSLRLNMGIIAEPKVCWNYVNFDDEYKAAKVNLCIAQTKKIEKENEKN